MPSYALAQMLSSEQYDKFGLGVCFLVTRSQFCSPGLELTMYLRLDSNSGIPPYLLN